MNRVGHHSTSDDSTLYREKEEIQEWDNNSPILRLRNYIEKQGWWNEEQEKVWIKSSKKDVNSLYISSLLKICTINSYRLLHFCSTIYKKSVKTKLREALPRVSFIPYLSVTLLL